MFWLRKWKFLRSVIGWERDLWTNIQGLHRWLSGKEYACQCRRYRRCGGLGFDPWVRKIPWSRKWQPTPVLLHEKSHRRAWRATVHGVVKSWHDWVSTHTLKNIWSVHAFVEGGRKAGMEKDWERERERERERQTGLQSKCWSDLLKHWTFREQTKDRWIQEWQQRER